jgi:hypothetical protein
VTKDREFNNGKKREEDDDDEKRQRVVGSRNAADVDPEQTGDEAGREEHGSDHREQIHGTVHLIRDQVNGMQPDVGERLEPALPYGFAFM